MGLGAGLAMVHTLTKPVGSPPAFVFYMGTQFSHLDYRVGMIGGKWGFSPNGSHSFEGGVRGNEQLLWENISITVMYNKTNAKLGNVLVTWPCGV